MTDRDRFTIDTASVADAVRIFERGDYLRHRVEAAIAKDLRRRLDDATNRAASSKRTTVRRNRKATAKTKR